MEYVCRVAPLISFRPSLISTRPVSIRPPSLHEPSLVVVDCPIRLRPGEVEVGVVRVVGRARDDGRCEVVVCVGEGPRASFGMLGRVRGSSNSVLLADKDSLARKDSPPRC